MSDRDHLNPKALREARNWSQGQMADYLGCDQSTVSRIENGAPASGPVRRLLERLRDDVAAGAAA